MKITNSEVNQHKYEPRLTILPPFCNYTLKCVFWVTQRENKLWESGAHGQMAGKERGCVYPEPQKMGLTLTTGWQGQSCARVQVYFPNSAWQPHMPSTLDG